MGVAATGMVGAAVPAACALPGSERPAGPAGPALDLTLWCMNYLPHNTAWERILAEWEATGARERVHLEPQNEWATKYAAAVAAGTTPDLATELGSGTQLKFARGWYEPLDRVYRDARVDPRRHFFAAAYEPWEFQGKPFGIPFEDTGPGFGIVIRTDFIKDAGQPVPAGRFGSWDEAYELAKRLVRREGPSPRWGWSTKAGWLSLWLFGAMVEGGQEYFDKSSQRFQLNTPVGVDVLKKLIWDPVYLHQVEPPEGLPTAQTMLKEGDLAMAIQSQAVLNQARLEKRESAEFLDFVIRPPFKGNDVRIIGEGGWGVSLFRGSPAKDAAAPFLSYLMGERAQAHWNIVLECRSSATAAAYKSSECQQPRFAFNHRVWAVQQQGRVRYFGNDAGSPADAYGVINRVTDELRAGTLAPKRAAELADEELNRKHEEFRAALAAARP
jgi:ABC-type glycerol-3-phosphate transport system substrate-binding protein